MMAAQCRHARAAAAGDWRRHGRGEQLIGALRKVLAKLDAVRSEMRRQRDKELREQARRSRHRSSSWRCVAVPAARAGATSYLTPVPPPTSLAGDARCTP